MKVACLLCRNNQPDEWQILQRSKEHCLMGIKVRAVAREPLAEVTATHHVPAIVVCSLVWIFPSAPASASVFVCTEAVMIRARSSSVASHLLAEIA